MHVTLHTVQSPSLCAYCVAAWQRLVTGWIWADPHLLRSWQGLRTCGGDTRGASNEHKTAAKAVQMCVPVTAGLAEPAAVIFVALVLPVDLSPQLVEQMLAGVGGIMCASCAPVEV